jgi:hypothetical protein
MPTGLKDSGRRLFPILTSHQQELWGLLEELGLMGLAKTFEQQTELFLK